MTDRVDEVKALLAQMTMTEKRQVLLHLRSLLPPHPMEERLMLSSDAMLEALARSGDLTIRMIRGIFAEAAFASDVLPIIPAGWHELKTDGADPPYDFLLTDHPSLDATAVPDAAKVRVQVKMQRSENKVPLPANKVWSSRVKWPSDHWIVEVQRSRKGERGGESTRPYRFGEFDILAVSLGPSVGRWSAFIYTVERWLLPDSKNPANILTFQPVAPSDNDCWTSDLMIAVEWFRGGKLGRINGDLPG